MGNQDLLSFFKRVGKILMFYILRHAEEKVPFDDAFSKLECKLGERILRFSGMTKTDCRAVLEDDSRFDLDDADITLQHNIFVPSDEQETVLLVVAACNLIVGNAADDHVDVNRANKYGYTALHLVAASVDWRYWYDIRDLLQDLVNAGADMMKTNNDGWNVLHMCVASLDLQQDEDGHVRCVSRDIVYLASYWNKKVIFFLDKLAPPLIDDTKAVNLINQQDRDGNTVVHLCTLAAAQYSNSDSGIELLQRLSRMGAFVNIANNSGYSPLHFACDAKLFKFLMDHGCDRRARSYQGKTPLLAIMKRILRLLILEDSPLSDALEHEFNTVFGESYISIHSGLFMHHSVCNIVEIVQMEEVRETLFIADDNGISPLALLLVFVRFIAYDRRTLYHRYRFDKGQLLELLTLFLDASNQCDVQTSHTLRFLQQKHWKKQTVLHVLLDMGANVKKIRLEETPLILQYLEELLKSEANVNTIDQEGQTVMHLVCRQYPACPSFFNQCIAVLKEHNPNLDIKDKSGATVHDLASNLKDLKEMDLRPHRKVHCEASHHYHTALNLVSSPPSKIAVVRNYRYSNDSFINRGSFGAVYVAIKDEHQHKKSKVISCTAFAIKKVTVDPKVVDPKHFEREVNLLVNLQHKCRDYIVSYHETFSTPESYYIVLELMDGDLGWFTENDQTKQLLKRNSDEMAQAALNILKGLKFLHDNDFIHQDLTPSNILVLLSKPPVFKIANFGLANNLSASCLIPSTVSGVLLGTRCWMAPELLSGQSTEHTKETDVFALGLVFHYLFSLGLHPAIVGQASLPLYEVEKNIAEVKFSLNGALSYEATHLLNTMLAKTPSERGSASELQQHVFFWSDKKKTEFLRAVGNEGEAAKAHHRHQGSALAQDLQNTDFGKKVAGDPTAYLPARPWDVRILDVYNEMTKKPGTKKSVKTNYDKNCVLDLLRFIRNAYAHKEERSTAVRTKLEKHVFLEVFPTLFLDVYGALKSNLHLTSRNGIKEASKLDI